MLWPLINLKINPHLAILMTIDPTPVIDQSALHEADGQHTDSRLVLG
jgi:hypothetical protein